MFNKHLKNWLKLVLAIALPPLLILAAGIFFIFTQKQKMALSEFKNRSANILEKLSQVADTQKYICLQLNEIFENSTNISELTKSVNQFSRQHKLSFNFLVWNDQGDVYS
jgi:uncharacterized membrane protein affecting hemolysin expression